jgi:hypothetical protein
VHASPQKKKIRQFYSVYGSYCIKKYRPKLTTKEMSYLLCHFFKLPTLNNIINIILPVHEAHYLTLTAEPNLTTKKQISIFKQPIKDIKNMSRRRLLRRRYVKETLCVQTFCTETFCRGDVLYVLQKIRGRKSRDTVSIDRGFKLCT